MNKNMKAHCPTPSRETALPPVQNPAISLNRILVVDDDSDVRELCMDVLTGSGCQVDTAEDGEAGWKLLEAFGCNSDSYDLLITDNNMPNLSGLELILRLRAARFTLPIVLISGELPLGIRAAVDSRTPLNQFEWNRSLRISAALPKPFTIAVLLRTVKRVLRQSCDHHAPFCVGPNDANREGDRQS
jgi:CheY-like chemotaxis protein